MANQEQLALLKQGVEGWNEWRKNNWFDVVDLSKANLRGTDLIGANLIGADLRRAHFIAKDLAQADYTGARFVDDELAFFANQADQQDRITRSIEFTPEYYQSGVSILSYFGQVLRDKYPDTKAKVTIEQDGLTVRMIIETPEGEQEQIEETLRQYGLVVTGKMLPNQLLTNELQIIQLKNEMRLAVVKLEQNKELLEYQKDRTRSLEEDKRNLFTLIEHGIGTQKDLKEIITQLLSKQSDVDAILQSLEEMDDRSADMQDTLELVVRELQRTNPDMLDKIHLKLLDYAASGTVGNAVYAGLLKLIDALPKV